MSDSTERKAEFCDDYRLTNHARSRMSKRSLSPDAIRKVLTYGRVSYTRGAKIHAIGRKEVKHFSQEGIDLSSMEGVQVVCNSDGVIITAYRNRDFRGLRPRKSRSRHCMH